MIRVSRTSKYNESELREYEDLKDCVDTLLGMEFGTWDPELIISRPKKPDDCEYCVEIYDTWRE